MASKTPSKARRSASKPKTAAKPSSGKSDLEKRLTPQVRAAGATMSVEDDNVVLSRPGERNTLLVTEETDEHSIERFLRGANV